MGDRQKLIQHVDQPGKHLAIYTTEDIETLYSDGISNIKVGAAISKLDFFVTEEVTTLADGEIEEKRVIRFSVAIPTLQLLQGISVIISQATNFTPQMEAAIEVLKNETSKQLKSLSVTHHDNS